MRPLPPQVAGGGLSQGVSPFVSCMTLTLWLRGARPHTWANAFAPVIAALALVPVVQWSLAVLSVLTAWALTVGVNFANDYSDGIRGTDDVRRGPPRLTASGVVPAVQVRRAAFAALTLAAIAGMALALWTHPALLLPGAACLWAAWFYTGGRRPYGYRGWGEVAVFVFYGPVAVLGTLWTQDGRMSAVALAVALGMGCMSASVNLANNLRDIPTDTLAGKRTLAVRLGEERSRALWLALVLVPLVVAVGLGAWLALGLALPWAAAAAWPVLRGQRDAALIPVLGRTGRAMLGWAVGLALRDVAALGGLG